MSFMRYDLGFFDHETCGSGARRNPFSARVLPMSPVKNVTYVTGIHRSRSSRKKLR